nr:MAG TPA: hypothetical protein [Caudoviricetes sp.]
MNLYINNNTKENEDLLKEIKKECKLEKELSSVICFFEYIPEDSICYIRNVKNSSENNRVENPMNNNVKNLFKNNFANKIKFDSGKTIVQENNDKVTDKNKCYYIKYLNKDFYFIHDIIGRTRVHTLPLPENNTKTANDMSKEKKVRIK